MNCGNDFHPSAAVFTDLISSLSLPRMSSAGIWALMWPQKA
jgi:hypothetical protein